MESIRGHAKKACFEIVTHCSTTATRIVLEVVCLNYRNGLFSISI